MFFQRSTYYHLGWWGVGGVRWFFTITCHILPHVLEKIHILPFRVGGGSGGSGGSSPLRVIFFPMFLKRSTYYHLGWGGLWGCPDGSPPLHVIFFPMFFQRSMSLPLRVGEGSFRGPDGSSSLHVIFFPMFLQRSMSLPLRSFRAGARTMQLDTCHLKLQPSRCMERERRPSGYFFKILMVIMMMIVVMMMMMMVRRLVIKMMMMMMVTMMMVINVVDPLCDSGETMAWNRVVS